MLTDIWVLWKWFLSCLPFFVGFLCTQARANFTSPVTFMSFPQSLHRVCVVLSDACIVQRCLFCWFMLFGVIAAIVKQREYIGFCKFQISSACYFFGNFCNAQFNSGTLKVTFLLHCYSVVEKASQVLLDVWWYVNNRYFTSNHVKTIFEMISDILFSNTSFYCNS